MRKGGGILIASFALAFGLTILPLPEWGAIWRPAWVALVLIYWCFALPQRVGVFVGWFSGLLLDVLSGTLLGQHALGLALIAFSAHRLHQRVRVLPLWQQAFTIFGLIFLYHLFTVWVNGMRGLEISKWEYVAGSLTSMLLWPWIFIVLRDIQRRFQVA